MLHENVHVPYKKNVETNPRISRSKIIGTTEFCSSGQASKSDDVIDFHINYQQIPTKDRKSKDQANALKHMYHRELTVSLSLMKRKIIQKLMFSKRIYLKRIIYGMVKVV